MCKPIYEQVRVITHLSFAVCKYIFAIYSKFKLCMLQLLFLPIWMLPLLPGEKLSAVTVRWSWKCCVYNGHMCVYMWIKKKMQILFLQGWVCGFNQHNNKTGTEKEETMEERGCRGRWSAAYKEKQSHTVCREQGQWRDTQNTIRKLRWGKELYIFFQI